MIQVYTGDGKGKTTAAFGQAFRAAGAGLKVKMVQFGKIEPSSEGKIAIENNIFDVECFWLPGFLKPGDDPGPYRKKTLEGIEYVHKLIENNPPDMLVLDEIIVVYALGVIDEDEFRTLLQSIPEHLELVLTGRGAPEWLIEKAHLVTEMKKIKHYYDLGMKARNGIEQ
ncbi:MAG: cob(I)yrinic acid a,c-diamide adenosyltransferase [Candidatus Zixiibacteriota bacterium]